MDIDQRGFTKQDGFDKVVRLLNPGINIDDLKKLASEYKHPKMEKFDIVTLDKTIKMANDLEEKSKEDIGEDHINHENNSDLREMLKMFTKHAIRKKFYFRDLFLTEDKSKTGLVDYRKFTKICDNEGLVILPGNVSQMRKRYENNQAMINYMKIEKDMTAINPRYKQFVGENKIETRDPHQLLESYAETISTKFNSLTEFCTTLDT